MEPYDISRHSLDKLDRAATKLEQAVAGNVTMEDKQDLEKLLTKAGFKVIIVEGEADVYIGYTFQLGKKQQVLERLGLEPFALSVLGIVSGNDYVPNVPGLAIRRNAELLKQLQTHQRMSKELLDAYVIATDADSLGYDFTSAYNIELESKCILLDISDNRHSLHTRGVPIQPLPSAATPE
ncbi:hypothetical protein SeMB42_g02356 [Synchytrium endobioticum]|uniref:Uncharacterized protein n=1 Tax=Synchytrium endobioticum TaxID=286115 RepID=A0A507DEN3_9FUNG|nr:hypothetical protein SeMB42_g02356 [Synchytrium endobioticum]